MARRSVSAAWFERLDAFQVRKAPVRLTRPMRMAVTGLKRSARSGVESRRKRRRGGGGGGGGGVGGTRPPGGGGGIGGTGGMRGGGGGGGGGPPGPCSMGLEGNQITLAAWTSWPRM